MDHGVRRIELEGNVTLKERHREMQCCWTKDGRSGAYTVHARISIQARSPELKHLYCKNKQTKIPGNVKWPLEAG
jgi:hypothetical protein